MIDLRAKLREATRLRALATTHERDAVRAALRGEGGNVRRAAHALGINHRTLDKWLREGRYHDLYTETSRQPGRPASSAK